MVWSLPKSIGLLRRCISQEGLDKKVSESAKKERNAQTTGVAPSSTDPAAKDGMESLATESAKKERNAQTTGVAPSSTDPAAKDGVESLATELISYYKSHVK